MSHDDGGNRPIEPGLANQRQHCLFVAVEFPTVALMGFQDKPFEVSKVIIYDAFDLSSSVEILVTTPAKRRGTRSRRFSERRPDAGLRGGHLVGIAAEASDPSRDLVHVALQHGIPSIARRD